MLGFEVLETAEGREIPGEIAQALDETPETMQDTMEKMGEEQQYAPGMVLESTPARDEIARRVNDRLEVDEFNKAPSMEVQAREIGEYFRETPELRYENWREMGLDERLSALQSLENEAAAIAHRPAMGIHAENLGAGHMGQSRADGLVINSEYLMNDSFEMYVENLDTIIHEGRHAYQNRNIFLAEMGLPVLEQNTEWVNSWRVNELDLGYSQSGAFSFDGMGFERYYTQPVEVDARAFAAQAIREMGLC